MQGRSNLGGSLKINGLLEEYKVASGGNVNAGDFVKWIDKFNTDGSLTTQIKNSNVTYIRTILLNDTKVFISYIVSSTFYSVVCEFSNNQVTVGTETTLNESVGSFDIIKLSENKIVGIGTYSNYQRSLKFLISGLLIEAHSYTISGSTPIKAPVRTTLMDENRMIAVASGTSSSSPSVNAVLYNISEDYPKQITSINLNNSSHFQNTIDIARLNDNKALITFAGTGTTYNKIYGEICTISNDTLTDSTRTLIGSCNGGISTVAINSSQVVIFYISSNTLFAVLCTINNEELTISSKINIGNSSNLCSVLHTTNKVLINYYYQNKIYGVVVTNNNDELVVGEIVLLQENVKSDCFNFLLMNNKNLLTYNTDTALNSKLFAEFKNGVYQLESNTDNIFGVAKTKGTDGQMVKIYVPDVEAGGG